MTHSSNSFCHLSQEGKLKKTTNGLGRNSFSALKVINPLLGKAMKIIYKIILFNRVSAISTEENKWLVI